MMAHVYRVGESDGEGLHESTSRVTMSEKGTLGIPNGPALILGVRPHTTIIPMSQVRWFWVGED